ncbi:hypothetical protein GCM10012280_09310 [Wenjunlia tyrosinilytica]|uniref:Uncharacterized protein n=1 Tax=Wenjunlia tyrosinilytica TaxID=1544741 RepID=A0A917ZFR8_9ACTN|nr:hypothetical protein GCM10012280_09310 [Wenjunlia tyrosinilytica]
MYGPEAGRGRLPVCGAVTAVLGRVQAFERLLDLMAPADAAVRFLVDGLGPRREPGSVGGEVRVAVPGGGVLDDHPSTLDALSSVTHTARYSFRLSLSARIT